MTEPTLVVVTVAAAVALVAIGLITPKPRKEDATVLVLTRRINEAIVITTPDGTEIRIAVVEWDRQKVRLSFAAPDDVVIDRLEVHTDKQAQRYLGGKS